MDDKNCGQVTLQIRSPSLNETLTVTIERDSSVRSLKELLQKFHPRKPPAADQRLIFSGRILDDADELEKVLEKTDSNTTPTFHLVVKPAVTARSKPTRTKAVDESSLFNAASSSSSANAAAVAFSSPSSFEAPQQQQRPIPEEQRPLEPPHAYPQTLLPGGYQVVAINGQYYLAPVLVPAFNPPPLTSVNHNGHATANSSNAYIDNRYFDQHAHNASSTTIPPPPPRSPVQPAGADRPPQQQQPAAAAAPLAHRDINAQRVASVWLAIKLGFILFILCQDASLERILIFHFIALVFFMYQTGRLRFVVRRVRIDDRQRFAPQQPQQQQQPDFVTGQQRQQEQRQRQDTDAVPEPPTTLLGTLKRGLYAFIASLWPSYGRDARIAQAFNNGQQDAWQGF